MPTHFDRTQHASFASTRLSPFNNPRPNTVYLYVQVRISGATVPFLVPRLLEQLPVTTHTSLFRKYHRSFTGAQLVYFLYANRLARSEREALAIGNALLRAGVFRHVRNEYLFRNGHYIYRFAAHEDYAVEEDHTRLRSSRMMTVACNSHMTMPEIRRLDTAGPAVAPAMTAGINFSDATIFARDVWLPEEQPEFDEEDVAVETGIRIGRRVYPNLVSDFTNASEIVGTNYVKGRLLEKSFSGRAATKWLVRNKYAKTTAEGIGIGNAMLSAGVLYPLETDNFGFECNDAYYRMMADTDITKELKRGARKDLMLRFLGINRIKVGRTSSTLQSPWFDDQLSYSFASASTLSR